MSTSRRTLLGGGAAALAVAGAGVLWAGRAAPTLTPAEAAHAAASGEVLLVDIRRPDEWAATGVPEGAVALDMRRRDFAAALARHLGEDSARPVALICAGGVRSAWLARQLDAAGFTQVIDVPEGMLGSAAGPGWIARGLPVVAPGAS